MKLYNCKAEGQGSVIAEVGSEHCDSDGHDTDLDPDEVKGQAIDQIDVLRGTFSSHLVLLKVTFRNSELKCAIVLFRSKA